MKCPICNVDLLMTTREGVEIDYCPKCRGVWLDRGELDKIIDKSSQTSSYKNEEREVRNQDAVYEDKRDQYSRPKKRESFLSDLFDF